MVGSVALSLLDRIFNDQTLGIQFLLDMNNHCVSLSKEEKFEVFLEFHFQMQLLVQIYEHSQKLYEEVVGLLKQQEKNLIGHSERIIREEENLTASLDNAFEQHMVYKLNRGYVQSAYFNEELANLSIQFKNTINSNMAISITTETSKYKYNVFTKQK